MAFITSQGVLNSAKNEPIRQALMQNCNLVSAIRLPNNLFTDYAGTEVGSDLIVLQKNNAKSGLSQREQQFCSTYTTADNTTNSLLFENGQHVVHTTSYQATDMYGKPALIYEHKEGVEGIAKDLKKMLSDDISNHLDSNLYNRRNITETISEVSIAKAINPVIDIEKEIPDIGKSIAEVNFSEASQLSLFSLYENTPDVKNTSPKKKRVHPSKRKTVSSIRQGNLFDLLFSQNNTMPLVPKEHNRENKPILGDLFSDNSEPQNVSTAELRIYTDKLQSFYRKDCLVTYKGYVGYLTDIDYEEQKAEFEPLPLPPMQKNTGGVLY